MNGQEIRNALHNGDRVYASAVVGVSSQWPKIMKDAGADFVFIDSEHTPQDRNRIAWMCRLYAANGIPPVVRIPSPDPYAASMVLDGGATGFIAPYIESVDDVKRLMGVARYRPLKGNRLEEAVENADSLEPELRTYLDNRNHHTIFIANIESVPALENLEAILGVGAIDAVLIGPHDLSCSLGIPENYDHPRFDEAVREIFRIARNNNVGAGIHFWLSKDKEVDWVTTAGANLIMHSTDITLYGNCLKLDMDELRQRCGDAARTDGTSTHVI